MGLSSRIRICPSKTKTCSSRKRSTRATTLEKSAPPAPRFPRRKDGASKLAQTAAEIKRQHPESTVETWAEDEHRIGLQPVNRIIGIEKGQQPIAKVNWQFQWLWLAGLVHPNSGETYWWIVPKLNNKVFRLLLEDFARHFELGKKSESF